MNISLVPINGLEFVYFKRVRATSISSLSSEGSCNNEWWRMLALDTSKSIPCSWILVSYSTSLKDWTLIAIRTVNQWWMRILLCNTP